MRDKKLGLKVTEEELTQVIPKEWLGGSVSRDTAYEIAYALREYMEKRVSKGRGLVTSRSLRMFTQRATKSQRILRPIAKSQGR